MAGMDGMAYVRADPVERAVMREIYERHPCSASGLPEGLTHG
jgi:hypothetical protein